MQSQLSGVRRYRKWKPILLIAVLGLAACAGEVPTAEQQTEDNKIASAGQILRVANLTAESGDLASATSLYQRAHRLAPDEIEPLLGVGRTSNATRQYSLAAEAFRKALEIDPKNILARRGFGRALIAVNQPEKAVEQYEAALKIDAADVLSYNGLGVALNLMGDPQGAEKRYRDGLKIAPESLLLRNNLALSLAFGGDYVQSLKILQQVVFDPRSSVRNRQNLALVYGLSGQMDKAAAVARIDLNEAQVKNNLAYYESLRSMAAKGRAAAILRGTARVETQPEKPVEKPQSSKPEAMKPEAVEPNDALPEPSPPPAQTPTPQTMVQPVPLSEPPKIEPKTPQKESKLPPKRKLQANIRPQRKPEIAEEIVKDVASAPDPEPVATTTLEPRPEQMPTPAPAPAKTEDPKPEPAVEQLSATPQDEEIKEETAAVPATIPDPAVSEQPPSVDEPKPIVTPTPDAPKNPLSTASTVPSPKTEAVAVQSEKETVAEEQPASPIPEPSVEASETVEPTSEERPEAVEASETPTPVAATEIIRVQLSSRRSADAVREEWAQLKAQHQDLLGDLDLTVLPANLGADRVIYRLLAGPLSDRESARSLCKDLTEKKVGCRVVASGP